MKHPKPQVRKVKLGCFNYHIHFQPNDGDDHGSTSTENKTIFICSSDPIEVQQETLLHELQHVAYEDCSLFKHPIVDADEQEESLIRYSNPKLLMYLNDNKWLKEFIFG